MRAGLLHYHINVNTTEWKAPRLKITQEQIVTECQIKQRKLHLTGQSLSSRRPWSTVDKNLVGHCRSMPGGRGNGEKDNTKRFTFRVRNG